MKIALVHDYLVQDGGAERVLQAFQEIWPDAPTYTLLYDRKRMGANYASKDIRTSSLQKLPFSLSAYKWLMPFMPVATEGYDLSGYDVVLTSTSAFAKGVLTRPETLHICYCHTPTRYLWSDTHTYLQYAGVPRPLRGVTKFLLASIRTWDRQAADRVDRFVANSKTVQRRVTKYYQRDSQVLHPPVDISAFRAGKGDGGYYVAGGRLVAYKRFDLIIQAFNRLGIPLKIFGEGPESGRLRAMANGNVTFLGRIPEQEKADLYAGAIAYIHPQEEDFGITAIEAMASGRPVIAFRKGGATETVVDGVTGTFFDTQTWEALTDVIIRFRPETYDPETIRSHAFRFDGESFKLRMKRMVEEAWAEYQLAEAGESVPAATEHQHATHRDRHTTLA